VKIATITVQPLTLDLATPFVTARRTATQLTSAVVVITTDTGHTGYGEAPNSYAVTGDTPASVEQVVTAYIAPLLTGRSVGDLSANIELLHTAVVGNTAAKAAVDMALYDLWGQLHGAPLYQLLGGYRHQLVTDMTLSIGTPEQMVTDAKKHVANGFTSLKVKTGKGGLADLVTLQAIGDAVGHTTELRIDANQGWTPKEAVRIIQSLEAGGYNLAFVEQPVHADDLSGLKFVTDNTLTTIMADESAFSPAQTARILQQEIADAINIKLAKAGGIYRAIQICHLAQSFGKPCMIGSMLESDLGATAAAHFGASQPNVKWVDLDTVYFMAGKAVAGGVSYGGSEISFGTRAGLGVTGLRNA